MERRQSIVEAAMKELTGANMDIDLTTPVNEIAWQQAKCPWNELEDTNQHRCAIKNISICPYFCGVEYPDLLLCCYPDENPYCKTS
jgi:hypothetical protein